MAWMRLMGADSVAYHKATVLSRGDDHPGQALAYYASRGETPLVWGGSGAERLGLSGAVSEADYDAIYGPRGAVDHTTGTRLVRTTRPGMELVISAHKSVAELGVLGRAEHMHAILDAERDATLSYLDKVTRDMGGRRGRARLEAEARAVIAAGPPDLRPQLQEVERQLRRLDQVEEDLEYGRGAWEGTEVAEAYRQMMRAQADHYEANRTARDPSEGFLSRRKWRREAEELAPVREAAEARFEALVEREGKVLGQERKDLEATRNELEFGIERRQEWLGQHPEVGLRLEAIGKELTDLGVRRGLDPTLDRALGLDHLDRLPVREPPTLDQGLGMDLGL